MKVAIISDIHENFHNLTLFFESIQQENVEKIICLGDLINPGIAKILSRCGIPVYAIWGNNDWDRVAITKIALAEGSGLEVGFDTFDCIELGGRKIFLTHYPMLANPMAKSGDFDAVFYGHNHLYHIDHINDCLIVNPGELSAHQTYKATFAIYDTQSNQAEIITLEDAVSVSSEKSEAFIKSLSFDSWKSKSHPY